AVELPQRYFAEDAQAFAGVALEKLATPLAAIAVRRWLHRQDANGVDLAILVEPGVGALVVPVQRHAIAVAGQGVESLPRVVAARVRGCHLALGHHTIGIALAL